VDNTSGIRINKCQDTELRPSTADRVENESHADRRQGASVRKPRDESTDSRCLWQ
jgi:hypothetical protein